MRRLKLDRETVRHLTQGEMDSVRTGQDTFPCTLSIFPWCFGLGADLTVADPCCSTQHLNTSPTACGIVNCGVTGI